LTSPSDGGVARLQRAVADLDCAAISCRSLGEIAFSILRDARAFDGASTDIDEIDDVRASLHFERAGAELFALDWTEFVSAEIDPEITGLRAPERFSAAAFRLIRKLRSALISPDDFKAAGLRGAATFYGKPPNFANPHLIAETQAKYRDSLRVTTAELERQRSREIDLLKILWRLYVSYVDTLVANGCLTAVDAVYEATKLLRERAELRQRARARFAAALVDDAQDLTAGGLGLLAAIFGETLAGVTLAGDPSQSTRDFAGGGRGSEAFARATTASIAFEARYGSDPAIERVARRVLDPASLAPSLASGATSGVVDTYRADSVRDEARYVAGEVTRLLRDGLAPERIAVIVRNLGCAHVYVDALLARDVPVDVAGAASVYAYPAANDALAALWSAVDPFRHDYLLRNLEAPWLRLADASIAVLCGDAVAPQPLLFEIAGDDEDPVRSGRWDERRNVRLGRNVTRGDVDDRLGDEARARIVAFRETRARWENAARTLSAAALARKILGESALATLPATARGRFDGHMIARLLDDVDAFTVREPLASLADFLAYAESVAESEADLLSIRLRDERAVRVLDVEAAKGERFDAVFTVDVRAGAWPRYYVPDAFLFSQKYGMLPKDNVGDATAARTAKFTYVQSRLKTREKYNEQERRAFYCAATRATQRLYVSAAGRATRGVSAPELLAEIEKQASTNQRT
ncbi:MAG: ATP-dependent helicase, partial [Candidatus Eremiobacteraeota bacterium]|nr:ATP-dependent helicase [Candidatus Eremiobacteraeota bacterium]